jgi:hypothetical protein
MRSALFGIMLLCLACGESCLSGIDAGNGCAVLVSLALVAPFPMLPAAWS